MKFKIIVMREAGEGHLNLYPSTLIVMDECTLEATDTADAARTYASLFTAHGITRYAIGEQPYQEVNP